MMELEIFFVGAAALAYEGCLHGPLLIANYEIGKEMDRQRLAEIQRMIEDVDSIGQLIRLYSDPGEKLYRDSLGNTRQTYFMNGGVEALSPTEDLDNFLDYVGKKCDKYDANAFSFIGVEIRNNAEVSFGVIYHKIKEEADDKPHK